MKIQKEIWRYYASRLARIKLPDIKNILRAAHLRSGRLALTSLQLNIIFYVALIVMITIGYVNIGNETRLSLEATAFADRIDLKENMDKMVISFSEGMHTFYERNK